MVLGGAAGDEIDRLDLQLGSPAHALLLATSAGRHTDYYQVTNEDVLITVPGQGGTESPKVRADMVFFETSNGGAVFSVGSINWLGCLAWKQLRQQRLAHHRERAAPLPGSAPVRDALTARTLLVEVTRK
jgi:hypothetical protein